MRRPLQELHLMLGRLLAVLVALGFSTSALAQGNYPERNITMIVPFAAGGTSDIIARVAAEEMSQALGRTVVIENVGGAGGATGMTRLARAAPDGYTIGLGNTGTAAAIYFINDNLQIKPEQFAPIGLLAKTAPVIAIKKDFKAADVAGFVAHAKANPGAINLGHAGVGSSNYLICLNFLRATGINVKLVGYRGAAPALNDLLGGHIDGVCDTATSLKGSLDSGNVKGLVVGAPRRLDAFKSIPAAGELGLDAFQAQGWNAIFAPAGISEPVRKTLEAAVAKAVAGERFRKQMIDLVSEPAAPAEASTAFLGPFVTAEIARYRSLLAK
jgi:tripartite-type tricarboxylate transporter receptor subunit TctC